MGYTRNKRINAVRSREEQEDDALELNEKGYSFAAIASLLGISDPTAKNYVRDAELRKLKRTSTSEKNQGNVVPMPKRKKA